MNQSKWSKEVKKALIDKDMKLKQLSEKVGYCSTTISLIINGRYGKKNFMEVAAAINDVLEIKQLPEKPDTYEWCKTVRKLMIDKDNMRVGELAEVTGFNRDRISLVLNGSCDPIVKKAINEVFNISEEVSNK